MRERLGRSRHACRGVQLVFTGIIAVAALLSAPMSCSQAQGASQYQLKTTLLFNLTKFVEWPDASFPGADAPFVVCVIGQDPFGQQLDDYLIGRTVGDRSIEVDRYPAVRNLSEAKFCQIAFVSPSEKQRFRKVIGFFQGKSVLSVGDADGFVASGGAVEFQTEQDHVRFAINPDAVGRAKLTVSSKLLALAKIVHDDASKAKE